MFIGLITVINLIFALLPWARKYVSARAYWIGATKKERKYFGSSFDIYIFDDLVFFATARTIRPSVNFFKVTVPSRRNSISDFFTQKSTISASPAALVSNYSRYLRADQRILEFPCPEKNQNKSQQPSNLDPFRIVISLLTHLRVGNQSLLCESDLLFFFLLLEESKTAPTDR